MKPELLYNRCIIVKLYTVGLDKELGKSQLFINFLTQEKPVVRASFPGMTLLSMK